MRDGPDGAVLLAIARASLLEEVLPKVPPGQVYAVRMIANAMAIAARELAAEDAEKEARARILALYREAGMAEPEGDIERALAADIRAGRFDAHEAALGELLAWQVDARLKLANPRARRAGQC
jgi:hypothetical protein